VLKGGIMEGAVTVDAEWPFWEALD
jgi:hypothetical protein